MSDDQNAEIIEFSERDREDLDALGITDGDAPEFHPVLEVWVKVLEPAADVRHEPITPQWANKITGSYREISFADLPAVRDGYFDMLETLLNILKAEIAKDEDCLKWRSPEDDVEHNSGHYKQLLTDWQIEFMRREVEWDCTSPTAAVEIAVLGEVHKIIFSETGLTAWLDNIRFEFTEQDQAALAAALNEVREGAKGE